MAPLVISATCLFKMCTAGSAMTTKKPINIPKGIKRYFTDVDAIDSPIKEAIGIKPVLAPVKNKTNPIYV